MPSDSDQAKKNSEREALGLFLEAYAVATGCLLAVTEDGENPDFICQRSDGERIGVELTEITRSPEDKHLDLVLLGRDDLSPFDAQALVHSHLSRKEEARAKRYVQRIAQNMLVLLLTDASLTEVQVALDGCDDDFRNHGFEEVWITDYSPMEQHGTVDLFCLFPSTLWGYYRRPNWDTKPYG